jgi:hypothetical protein
VKTFRGKGFVSTTLCGTRPLIRDRSIMQKTTVTKSQMAGIHSLPMRPAIGAGCARDPAKTRRMIVEATVRQSPTVAA